MKFLHVADLHIGKTVNGFSMIDDQRHILNETIRLAKASDATALVIAGDFYDKSTPSAEAVSLVDHFLTEAVANGLKVIAVSGNHDSAERIAYASNLMRAQGVAISPVFNGSLTSFTVEDEHGTVRFWLAPFIKPTHVRPFFEDVEIGNDYTKAMECVLGTCSLEESERHVLVCHQFVTAGQSQPETSDSEISLGGLDNVDASVFEKFSYVALGHIHRAQRIGADCIRYSGSPLKYSFSEIKHVKSATLVEINAEGEASYELLPLNPLRDMREIKGPLETLVSEEIASELNREDYMRVILTDDLPSIDALARIRQTYPNVMSVEYENARAKPSSLDNSSIEETERIHPLELFARFYETQNGQSLSDEQSRLAQAAYLQATESTTGAAI